MQLEVTDMRDGDNEIYDIFLGMSYSQLKDLFRKAKSKQEQDFYMMLSNMVLQREQQKVIGK
ncbi:MAG: hypothetical protein ACI8WT_002128 [Clostridium sp.]